MPALNLTTLLTRYSKPAATVFGITAVAHWLCSMVFNSTWLVVGALATTHGTETDSGTGVLSLRSLTISLLESMALAERYNRNLSMVRIVIDDFEGIQSRFGTSAVDAAAAVLGTSILNAVRMPDRVGRYSPSCFVLVLPETDAIGARQFSERIRRIVVDEEIRAGQGQRFSISVSSGVATFESGDDPQRLIDRAENAVQEAQSLGGNRTAVFSTEL